MNDEKLRCQDCGCTDHTVNETICPYDDEILDTQTHVTLCTKCYKDRCQEI